MSRKLKKSLGIGEAIYIVGLTQISGCCAIEEEE
jgi:hypothetical protein